jgi:hypothetical protein
MQSAVAASQLQLFNVKTFIDYDRWSKFIPDLSRIPSDSSDIQRLKDANGNNLAHKILENWHSKLDDFIQTFRVVGIDAFREENNEGLNPIERNTSRLSDIFGENAASYVGDKAELTKLQDGLKPIIRESIIKLMARYKEIKQYAAVLERDTETDKFDKQRIIYDKLRNIIPSLGYIVISDVSAVMFPLEEIAEHEFYSYIYTTEAGRQLLKSYKTKKGKTLYNYFSDIHFSKFSKEDNCRNLLSMLFSLWTSEGQIPTATECDIKDISELNIGRYVEHAPFAKVLFERYKNSQGQNLAFLFAKKGEGKMFLKMIKDKGLNIDITSMLQMKDFHGNDGISQISYSSGYDEIDPMLSELIEKSLRTKAQEATRVWKQREEDEWRAKQEKKDLQEETFLKALHTKLLNDSFWNEALPPDAIFISP